MNRKKQTKKNLKKKLKKNSELGTGENEFSPVPNST